MSGGSMTANHLKHEIATFPGSLGRGRPAVEREAEEEWVKEDGDEHAANSLYLPRRYVDP